MPFCSRPALCPAGRETTALNQWNRVVVLRKERDMTTMALHVTRVSGIGEDTIFMAVCRVGAGLRVQVLGRIPFLLRRVHQG